MLQPSGQAQSTDFPGATPHLDTVHLWNLDDSISASVSLPDDPGDMPASTGTTEQLLELYYTFFHKAHPCALPPQSMRRRLDKDPESVKLLMLVMSFIGSLYAPSISSDPLEKQLRMELGYRQRQATGFTVQALLLYSIAVYWNNEIERSLELLDRAICMALDLGMHHREFALVHGEGDPVLEECWRRTWWQLYIDDMHIASSNHILSWKTSCVVTNVELPCEEDEYEAMVSR